nr:restriction endonuclease subunit S [uncultured Oscillibacter sp.]
MPEKIRVPAIRFAEFTDAWEQRKLGETLYSLRNNTLSRVELSLENGVAKNVHYGDVLVKFGEILDVEKEFLPMIVDESVVAKYRSSFLQNGDIVIADTAEDEAVGKCSEIAGLSDEKVIAGLHTIPCRPLFNFASGYLGYYLNSNAYHKQLLPLMQGIKVTSISKSALQDTEIQYPGSLEEQEQIGTFFRHLDHLITLHQRKYSRLCDVKKSMIEKMFPKDGASVPKIRFAGFTDSWEQRKFSEITFPSGVKNRDNLPLESYSITNENGFVPQDEKFENGGTMREADKRMYYIVSPHSFAYNPARINVGSIGYQNLSKDVIVSSLYEVFQTTDDIDDRFLWHWFKSSDFQKLIEQLQEGGVRLYFYYDKLCMGTLSFPSLEEQRKIGQCLDHLDHLITLHQRELGQLQNIKKSCLEKMFV